MVSNILKINGSRIKLIYILPWFCIFSFYSIALDGGMIVIFPPISKYIFVALFWVSQVVLFLFLLKNINKLSVELNDFIFIILFFIQITLTLKNFILSGSPRNFLILFSMFFYFFGLYNEKISIFRKENVFTAIILSLLVNLLTSVMLKMAFFLQNPELILIGADIPGGSYEGVFLGRATGLYTSPLTLSGFMLIGVFICSYLVFEKKQNVLIFFALLLGLLLTVSRGSFIACILFFVLLCLKKPNKLNSFYTLGMVLSSSIAVIYLIISGFIDLSRLFAKSSIATSSSTRISNHTNNLVDWISNPISVIFGDNSNSMGIDSDILNYVFNYGIIVLLIYSIIFTRLLFSKSSENYHVYLKCGLIAKLTDGLFAGSVIGMPSSFIIFYLLGFWSCSVSKKQKLLTF